MSNNTFADEFKARFEEIKVRAAALDMTVTDVCKAAHVARATPERWKKTIPMTIRIIDRMFSVIEAKEALAAEAASTTQPECAEQH